jgi:cyclophilin family peptidyl-prolyl cis-trans isomerase
MGKIKKIKQERKRAEVERQIKKMRNWRNFRRSLMLTSLLAILLGGGFFGYKYLTIKYPNLAIKWGNNKEKEEAVTERKTYTKVPEMQIDVNKKYTAKMSTSAGEIALELNTKEVPNTVNNFVVLSRDNFYNDVVFHRIIKDFMIQTGDPEGTGAGGPGYKFADEPFSGDYAPGTLAMANSGANTNGSQFFITTTDQSGKLPKNYTIFGKVISGMDIVSAIANTPVDDNGQGEKSKPKEEVKIIKIEITEE